MIKISLLLISIFSLLYGLVFSFAPFFFAELTQAEPTNIAWLRNIGASILLRFANPDAAHYNNLFISEPFFFQVKKISQISYLFLLMI